MEITRTRTLTIRMGDYESFVTGATVRMEFADDTPELAIANELNSMLDAVMADDIADAQELSGDRKSFIHRIPNQKD